MNSQDSVDKNSDPSFGFLSWKNPADGISEYVRSDFDNVLADSVIQYAELNFYKTFTLLSVTDSLSAQFGTRPRRAYALVRPKNDGFQIVPLNGTSPPIHGINAIPNELTLTNENADDYLRFFCSAVHGQEGPFLVLEEENFARLLSADHQEKVRRALNNAQLKIQSEDKPEVQAEFAKFSNPFPASSIKRRKVYVIYSSALFRAWFAIDKYGMVQMLDDEPIQAELAVSIPKYADGTLFELHKLSEKPPVTELEPAYQNVPDEFLSQVPDELFMKLKQLTARNGREDEIIFCDGDILECK